MEKDHLKGEVKNYWEQEPCGSGVAQSAKYTKEYFDEIEEHRYRVEPFIHRFAQFTRYRGKKVLEVGVGAGTDHLQFARAGALLSGIDLTEAAVAMVTKRLALEGLTSDLRCADAEHLPFEDGSFDLVYSWGVLHHTPDTEKALAEVHRVCKPGGKVCVMLYHSASLLGLKLWFVKGPMKFKPFRSVKDVIYHNMESIGTRAYTRREAGNMFEKLRHVRVTPILTSYDLVGMPCCLANYLPQAWGWFLVVQAEK